MEEPNCLIGSSFKFIKALCSCDHKPEDHHLDGCRKLYCECDAEWKIK